MDSLDMCGLHELDWGLCGYAFGCGGFAGMEMKFMRVVFIYATLSVSQSR